MTGSAGTDAPAAAAAGTTASSPTVDLPISGGSRSVRIRTFGGDRTAGVYEAWKDEVTTLMHIYGLQQKEMAPLVYLALEAGVGKPRDLVQHLDLVADIIQDKGVDTLIGTLDDEFEGKTYRRAEEASSAYYRTHRETGESMADYVSKLRVAKRTLELRDMGSTISNTSFAQRLLAKSGLPKPLRRQVLAAAGAAWDPAKITDALVLMYHDVHEEEAPRRRATGQANFKPSFSQHTTFTRPGYKGKGKSKGSALAADCEDDEEEEEEDEDDEGEEEQDVNAADWAEYDGEEPYEDEFDAEGWSMAEAYATGWRQAHGRGKSRGKGKPGRGRSQENGVAAQIVSSQDIGVEIPSVSS